MYNAVRAVVDVRGPHGAPARAGGHQGRLGPAGGRARRTAQRRTEAEGRHRQGHRQGT